MSFLMFSGSLKRLRYVLSGFSWASRFKFQTDNNVCTKITTFTQVQAYIFGLMFLALHITHSIVVQTLVWVEFVQVTHDLSVWSPYARSPEWFAQKSVTSFKAFSSKVIFFIGLTIAKVPIPRRSTNNILRHKTNFCSTYTFFSYKNKQNLAKFGWAREYINCFVPFGGKYQV